ncbi:MAG: hypothetical protein AAGK02_16665, partial [Pseudomonadota bacterium]
MFDLDRPDELREAITALKERGVDVRDVAVAADVKPTTLYSFMRGDTRNLRSDTLDKVKTALEEWYPSSEDEDLARVIRIWDHIPLARRKTIVDTAEGFADPSDKREGNKE